MRLHDAKRRDQRRPLAQVQTRVATQLVRFNKKIGAFLGRVPSSARPCAASGSATFMPDADQLGNRIFVGSSGAGDSFR